MPGRHESSRGGRSGRVAKGGHRARRGTPSSFSYVEVDEHGVPIAPPAPAPARGRHAAPEDAGSEEHPRVRHAGRDPHDEHPAPDVDERPAGGKPERRAGKKTLRAATGLGFLALTLCGAGVLIKGIATNNAPDKVPVGPALLDPTNHDVPGQANNSGNLSGNALKAKLHADVQRLVNNGEGDDGKGTNGTTVTVAPGILTIDTPDGQHVSYANPIVDTEGLPEQASANLRAGHLDASSWNLLDGRVFATGTAKNTPKQGQDGPNYDRGVVDIDVTNTNAHFTPAQGGPHLTNVEVSWETPEPIAVGAGGPLEQNTKTGKYGQHDVGGDWQPMLVGAQVATPPTPQQS